MKEKKGEFNSIINSSLHLQKGTYGFNFRNTTPNVAYQAVMASNGSGGINNNNNRIGTLFIVTLNTFENNVTNLIHIQRLINFFIILVIAAISSSGVFMILRWNKILQKMVDQKTLELKTTVQKLQKSNEELVLTKKSLEEANCQLIETNEKLKKANQGLELHDKMQKEFINIAAHELRTPIQAIAGNLELIEMIHFPSLLQQSSQDKINSEELESLLKDKEQFQEFKKELISIYRNSQRLEKLVNNILDIPRIESNRLKLNKEYFNLNEKIRNVIDDIRNKKDYSEKKNKDINIIFQSPKDPIAIYADKIRIFEVLSNIIENAIRFSENELIDISVKLLQNNTEGDEEEHKNKETVDNYSAATTIPTAVVVSIKDGGKGIDKEILPQLFTKFVTKSYTGTGLGLYLAKKIIEAHGGKIWAKNNKDGKGATFSFSLPSH